MNKIFEYTFFGRWTVTRFIIYLFPLIQVEWLESEFQFQYIFSFWVKKIGFFVKLFIFFIFEETRLETANMGWLLGKVKVIRIKLRKYPNHWVSLYNCECFHLPTDGTSHSRVSLYILLNTFISSTYQKARALTYLSLLSSS